MSDRRFNDEEVAAILARATETPTKEAPHVAPADGMTLTDLQQIGVEVGIAPEAIAMAADSIERGVPAAERRIMGLPLGVSRTVHLDRTLTDDEWERLVVDLRETFDARGAVKSYGSLRQWTNGNLAAFVEPTANGHRLRLRTVKGNALARLVVGTAAAGLSAVGFAVALMRGAGADRGLVAALGFMGIVGAGMLITTALDLPRWAATRRRQMDEIAARVARAINP
jgi:hypothetical protein